MSEVVNQERIIDSIRLALAHRDWLTVEERERIIGDVEEAIANNSDLVVMWEDVPYEVEEEYRQ